MSMTEAEEPNSNENGEHVECTKDGKVQESGNNENGGITVSHGAKCGKAKEAMENVHAEQSLKTDAGDDGEAEAEDAEHNANTKVDVDSSKDDTAENGKTTMMRKLTATP